MRRWYQFALLAAFAAAFLTWKSIGDEPPAAPIPQKKKAKAEKITELPPPPTVFGELVYAEPTPHDGTRNLFAYVTAPVAPVAVKSEPAQPVPVVSAPPEPPAPVRKAVEKPRFTYRYIGRFGPDENPVAAFVRDGEIVTAQRGDRVGEFVLREVGLESVEVVGDAGVVRVALGG
jgi:hypothetical protein